MDFAALVDKLWPSLIMAAGLYAGIRADLARLNEIATTARDRADSAHARINSILEK